MNKPTMSKPKITDANAATIAEQLIVEETTKSNAKESNVKAEVIVSNEMYKQYGETYFRELRNFINKYLKNSDGTFKINRDGTFKNAILQLLFNLILTPRLDFIQDSKNINYISDGTYNYGITIRIPINPQGGVDSCTTTGANNDFAIPNEDWSILVEQYKKGVKDGKITSINESKLMSMIDVVTCERRLCKDDRWKSGLNKLIYCPGSSGSQTIYPWLQTGTKGTEIKGTEIKSTGTKGGRTRKQKRHKKKTNKRKQKRHKKTMKR
jgi:hypothetical protein